jgi:hypothetical protein
MSVKLEDYGFVGATQTAALIGSTVPLTGCVCHALTPPLVSRLFWEMNKRTKAVDASHLLNHGRERARLIEKTPGNGV